MRYALMRSGLLLLVFQVSLACTETQATEDSGQLSEHVTAAETSSLVPLSQAGNPAVRRADAWQRMVSGYALQPLHGGLSERMLEVYGRHDGFVLSALQRSSAYISQVIDNVRQRAMPGEIALLPVIESGYEPRAVSPAMAAGIWQFIPETGRRFGLRKTWLRDERLDPLTATDAALDYLQSLYRQFGDWHLALAAYNCGEGCVGRAINEALAARRSPDFIGISPFLPSETREYVPRLLAVSAVAKRYHDAMRLPGLPESQVVRIRINQPADIQAIARVSGISLDEMFALNAGVLRRYVAEGDVIWITRAGLSQLRDRVGRARDDDDRLLLSIRPERAEAGESVVAFARRHAVNVEEVYRINGIARGVSKISSGTLFIPWSDGSSPLAQHAVLEPLRMEGGDIGVLPSGYRLSSRDALLLARHPEIEQSGWVPGRLRLKGGRPASK